VIRSIRLNSLRIPMLFWTWSPRVFFDRCQRDQRRGKAGIRVLEGVRDSGEHRGTCRFVGRGQKHVTNALLRSEKIVTQEIRDDDDRGRHTTTSSRVAFHAERRRGHRHSRVTADRLRTRATSTDFWRYRKAGASCRFTDCGHANQSPAAPS